MNAIITDSLTKTFVSKIGPTEAVKDLSLMIKANSIYGLIGHNGAGKTTTFMLLNTLLAPTRGSGWILGLDLVKDQKRIRQLTGLLTENLRLYDELTVEETLRFFADLYGVSRNISELLDRFELADWRKQQVGRLSTGMRKKVAILSACIHHPRLLFLDEPFSGLDPLAMQSLRDFIHYLLEYNEMTVIIASHNLRELADLCQEVGIMKEGRMVISGTLEMIKEKYGFHDYIELQVDGHPEGLEGLISTPVPGIISVVNKPEELQKVLVALAEQNIAVLDMEKQAAALEDVYQRVYQEVAQ
ncbi:MAG TPA: ABC transporter ATP-binding protein [Firmicutes bacterium]|jgi:ABC-2 type transport system ATP-binding protein|nr:ABC transporter ATP-binding protein [Bacillota bacterium]